MRRAVTQTLLIALLAVSPVSMAYADNNKPAQQSECEIQANAYRQKHPRPDFLNDSKHGVMFFGTAGPSKPPFAYLDPGSGVTFQVEGDGRHLSAKDARGNLLWIRNPFVEGNLCPYRSAHPFISWVGPQSGDFGNYHLDPWTPPPDDKANALTFKFVNSMIDGGLKIARPKRGDRFVGLSFNSSQFGYVNIRNGDFYLGGQN